MKPRAGMLGLAALLACLPGTARAVYECGGEQDTCQCGADNFCICCDGTCGNCVWHAWHMACCEWGRALEWCTDAQYFDDQADSRGYPTGADPADGSIFVCEPSAACSDWGHVGWVVTAYPDGSFDSTEQYCGGPCGTHARNRPAGFATGGFIYDPDGPPPERDDAAFVSESVPDGTHFSPGAGFVKRWTVRNTGNTTWTPGASYLWTFDGEEPFGAPEQTLLPQGASVAPGGTWDWEVPMTAPLAEGSYVGYWRMDRYGTHRFGDRCWVEIEVDPYPDADGDGYRADVDCDDGDPDVFPGAPERCNGIDDDCDGQTDEGCAVEPDAGTDAGTADAGGSDAGGSDAGAADAGPDAGAPPADAADGSSGADDGAEPDEPGGCSCASAPASTSLLCLLALLALAHARERSARAPRPERG